MDGQKERLAALFRRRPFRWLLPLAIRLMTPKHRIGVVLVTFNSRQEVLLLKHVYHPAAPWGLPGGWLGRNEDPALGLERELREETGLDVVIGPPVTVAYNPLPPHIIMAFLGWVGPGPFSLSSEILDAGWFSGEELPEPMLPFTLRALDAARPLLSAFPPPRAMEAPVTLTSR